MKKIDSTKEYVGREVASGNMRDTCVKVTRESLLS